MGSAALGVGVEHDPAYRLALAPKSVSIQALVGGDPRLIAAHREAVTAALGEPLIRRALTFTKLQSKSLGVPQSVHDISVVLAQQSTAVSAIHSC